MSNQSHAKTLSRLRNTLCISANELAKLAGVPRAKVENVERARIKLDPLFASCIQSATGVSAHSLMRCDNPLQMISGKPITLESFNLYQKKEVSPKNKELQKDELCRRIRLLLDAASDKGPGELRKVFSRLCDSIDSVREETGVSFKDLLSQARRSASIESQSMTLKELDKLLSPSPSFAELRENLPKRGKIEVLIESFASWMPLPETIAAIEGAVFDSASTETKIYRIKCGGSFHDVMVHSVEASGVGRPSQPPA